MAPRGPFVNKIQQARPRIGFSFSFGLSLGLGLVLVLVLVLFSNFMKLEVKGVKILRLKLEFQLSVP